MRICIDTAGASFIGFNMVDLDSEFIEKLTHAICMDYEHKATGKKPIIHILPDENVIASGD